LEKVEEVRAMKRTTVYEGFDPGKYGMIFCPDCRGSGKSFHDSGRIKVCKLCGGFGLIRKQDTRSIPGKEVPIELLK
jgi:DnaJ-class molecular chaperone